LTFSPDQLSPVPPGIAARLTPEAAEHVRTVDLTAFGLTAEDWGPVCVIGGFHTASRYDGAPIGANLEVFSGERRMTLARYPNEGYLRLDAVMDVGEVNEFPPQNYWRCNNALRNPRGGCYILDPGTNERVKRWQEPETAWAFGYFMWDWADSSTPVTFYTPNRAMYPRYVSNFGARAGAQYYLYNVLEELDSPGEYWLDRERGLLYVWTCDPGDSVSLSLGKTPLISGSADNVTIEGFTLTFARADGVTLKGRGNTLRRLTVKNTADHGIVVSGRNNLVEDCEVTRTGRGGIYLSGGNRETLRPGGNRAENCYIHDYSEVYQTYQSGVTLQGVGNVCSHCEIAGSPHIAVLYGGNDHLIEYNEIHDVVLHSSDAGAIYSGYDWCGHGTVVRYNLLYRIGAGEFRPDGIYWDDGLSGQTAYGNIVAGVPKNGFLVGGGFENTVRDNVIVGGGENPIQYDDRNREGFVHGGWAKQAVNTPDAPHWQKLRSIPYLSEPWRARFPSLGRLKTDFDTDPDDPDFPINPTGSLVENNIIIHPDGKLGWIADSVFRYGRVEGNRIFRTAEEAGFDPVSFTFTSLPAGFPEIPTEKIGRKKKPDAEGESGN
ncbi:MAG: right-handed parallel beta-helix repeat-containing protein, partial [Clostridia bacterium]|nr:right-handed parallel beta-helix repeat-containing protein [Clostridia bacterium]